MFIPTGHPGPSPNGIPDLHVDDEMDVLIVGAGLAGSFAAASLARQGVGVMLAEMHDQPLNEFRVEKITGSQIAALRRLGALEAVAAQATVVPEIVSVSGGRIIDRTVAPHYSILYPHLVRVARDLLPREVIRVDARVEGISPWAGHQMVQLSDGRLVRARLVVLASGFGDRLRGDLGMTVETLLPVRTLAFGFDLVPEGGSFPVSGATFYGERTTSKIDYLALLRSGDKMRGNLFTYNGLKDEWVSAFRRDPLPTLAAALPGFHKMLGDVRLAGRVQMFAMPVTRVLNPLVAGLVIIGDAYQTSCPAAGTGVTRLLSDVEVIARLVPEWLETPGMGLDKIATFYADKAKTRMDALSLSQARFRRSFTVPPNLAWRIRRSLSFRKRIVRSWLASALRLVRIRRGAPRGATA